VSADTFVEVANPDNVGPSQRLAHRTTTNSSHNKKKNVSSLADLDFATKPLHTHFESFFFLLYLAALDLGSAAKVRVLVFYYCFFFCTLHR
jgi:hypothetical protein